MRNVPDPADADRKIGERLLNLRIGTRWSQARVAAVVNDEGGYRWTNATVGEIERGERQLRLSEAVALCRALGIDLVMLTGDEPARRPSMLAAIHVLREFDRTHTVPTSFP